MAERVPPKALLFGLHPGLPGSLYPYLKDDDPMIRKKIGCFKKSEKTFSKTEKHHHVYQDVVCSC